MARFTESSGPLSLYIARPCAKQELCRFPYLTHEAAQASGVENDKLSEVLANLSIISGKLLFRVAFEASQTWAEMGEQKGGSQF